MMIYRPVLHLLVAATTYTCRGARASPSSLRRHTNVSEVQLKTDTTPFIPAFLNGSPEDDQTHTFSDTAATAPHIAWGKGLHQAVTGVPASFTILLVGGEENVSSNDKGGHGGDSGSDHPPTDWKPVDSSRFIYVWIASEDQILIAEVTISSTDGDDEGGPTILTATYKSDFPGDYLVHVEEVLVSEHGPGLPLAGSPFSLTVTTDDSDGNDPTKPTLDVDSLPVCGSSEDGAKDIEDTFWRPGTWLSSNVASRAHGVLRNGWVFQPKTCVYDTFSYEDLMRLSALKEPTWLLILGGSVQRGVFLSLVDMVMAQGQKDNFRKNVVAKCWGYADLQIGNLRLTYQDLRLYQISKVEDSVVCNNEKLLSGSTSAFLLACEQFLNITAFKDSDGSGPTGILAPSNLVEGESRKGLEQVPPPNVAIEVLMNALPQKWDGKVLFMEHMAAFETRWYERNPTMTALKDVGISRGDRLPSEDGGLGKFEHYQSLDPRVKFLSAFPMNQAKLFENQNTRPGKRHYGSSVHYHYVPEDISSPETHNGARMVQSTMTEMLANILIGEAVGTKEALYEKVAAAAADGAGWESNGGQEAFKLCWDCPKSLVPVHVKPIPEPVCEDLKSFPVSQTVGEVWDGELCPAWCMKEKPVSQAKTESDVVDVRECSVHGTPRLQETAMTERGANP